MRPDDRNNVVLCPSCRKTFCMAYVPSHKCPFCGCFFEPWDTMAGCPMRDEQSQLDFAKSILNGDYQ